ADQRAKGALYLLAVLADDLLASRAHLFVFPQAPLPARADLIEVELTEADMGRLQRLLDASVISERPVLDAVLVDDPLGAGPLVVDVSPGGAAQKAGIEVGDRIASIDGAPVAKAADVDAALLQRVETHA